MAKRKIDYVNKKRFFEEILEYKVRKEINSNERIPEFCGEQIYQIATGYGRRNQFSGYTFIEEMIGDAIENCIRFFDNFNPEISQNPFAYFTQICHFAFIRRIKKEKVYLATIETLRDTEFNLNEMAETDGANNINESIRQTQTNFRKTKSTEAKENFYGGEKTRVSDIGKRMRNNQSVKKKIVPEIIPGDV